jgi:DNA-binding XRE family transcriptional regulator
MKNKHLKSLDQFIDEQYGAKGSTKRDTFEEGYETFKLGVLLHQARMEKGLTQSQLAEKVGTNKSYISKIENNLKEIKVATLQRIVEIGLGGRLDVTIRL